MPVHTAVGILDTRGLIVSVLHFQLYNLQSWREKKESLYRYMIMFFYVYLNILVEYMPRLSLLYGTLTKEEKKAAQEKAYLLDESINGMNFQVSRLALWITDREDKGNLETWKRIAECSLSPD